MRPNARQLRQETDTDRKSRDYLLPDFFFAQYAFNFADNFALVAAGLNDFLLAVGLAERVAGFEPRTFAYLAL